MQERDALHKVPWDYKGNLEAAEAILKFKPERLNLVYSTIGTPLHAGILKGDLDFIKWLCWKGADPTISTRIYHLGRNYGVVNAFELGRAKNIDVEEIFRICNSEKVDETIGVSKNLPKGVTKEIASFLGGRKSLKRKRRRRRLTRRRF